ncbi:MAG: SGNH/GDSL hydrolase family protein [Cyanobacteria bacterium SBLK]|nr:SGNH/GDSL hydrolase family protein [Cyanobacteria bacterium SBLK]
MKKFVISIGLGILLFSLMTCSFQNKLAAQESRVDIFFEVEKIVFLGDSITKEGTREGGYIWLLQRYLQELYPDRQFELVNTGISGNQSVQMRKRFQDDVLSENPDLLFINVGVNDVWHAFFDFEEQKNYPEGNLPAGNSLEQYRIDLTEMVGLARENNIEVILLAPTPIRENLDSQENQRLVNYIAVMKAIAAENNCLFVNLNQPFHDIIKTYQKYAGTTQKILTRDGVHPNQFGYRVIAYTILKDLGISEDRLQNLRVEDCVGLCEN